MSTYARVQDGIVAELFAPPSGVVLEDCFAPSVASQFVDITAVDPAPLPGWTATQRGSTWSFSAPPSPPEATLAERGAAALSGGVTIALSGSVELPATLFPTDVVSRQNINAVLTALMVSGVFPDGTTTYPLQDSAGSWHAFSAPQYKAVAGAILAYAAALALIINGNPLGAAALPNASLTLSV